MLNKLNNIFLVMYLSKVFSNIIEKIYINNSIIYINIDKKFLLLITYFLKNNHNMQFKQILDIWGEDYLEKDKRFVVNYLLLSVRYNIRIILKVNLSENESIDSLTKMYNSSAWLEREVWDMFGIIFFNNNDLRRILTDYGFDGFPLRKDFPLMGYTEINYDYESKRILYNSLNLTQEIRNYIYMNPWIGN